jgi:hypothetical protein
MTKNSFFGSDFNVSELNMNFESEGFGPPERENKKLYDNQFDGRLFKPYNKRDKLGKLCEFITSATTT